jgi:hypothetical protein
MIPEIGKIYLLKTRKGSNDASEYDFLVLVVKVKVVKYFGGSENRVLVKEMASMIPSFVIQYTLSHDFWIKAKEVPRKDLAFLFTFQDHSFR